jgi:hypothetical protein
MSCQGKSNTVGLAVDYAPGVVAVAHHGCADAAFDETMKRYAFETTEAVIAELADKSLPMPVRAVMLRNLAMNGVPTERIADSLLDGEAYQYERYQGVRDILALAKLPPKTDPRDVIELSLSDQRLNQIPAGIGEFVNLLVLSLNDNKLASLPPEFWQLTNLSTLSLSSNQLTALPPEIRQLTKLEHLSLSSNQLTTLPPEVGQLTKLEYLGLGDNRLASLPPEIVELTNLTRLGLGGNGLTSVPPQITGLPNLAVLYLGINRLVSLPP